MIRILESSAAAGMLRRRAARFSDAEAIVRPILEDVRKRGDKALLEYARKFDKLERKSVAVPQAELDAAASRLSPQFRKGRSDLGKERAGLCEVATPGGEESAARPGTASFTNCPAARKRRGVHSFGTLPAAVPPSS